MSTRDYDRLLRAVPEMDGLVLDSGHCLIWLGTRSQTGYGTFNVRDMTTKVAHRIAYQREHGHMGWKQQVDHTCYVRACLNLAHLEAVSGEENTKRSMERRAAAAQAGVTLTPCCEAISLEHSRGPAFFNCEGVRRR